MTRTPTYDELMARNDIGFISECDDYLYVKLPAEQFFDDTIWKVDKKTKEVAYMPYTRYMTTVQSRAKYIKAPEWETQSPKESRGA